MVILSSLLVVNRLNCWTLPPLCSIWCKLRDFIESKDVDGVVSTTATSDTAKDLSERLLHKIVKEILDSGRLGLLEAAVTCVVSRCRSVYVDDKVGRIAFQLKNDFAPCSESKHCNHKEGNSGL